MIIIFIFITVSIANPFAREPCAKRWPFGSGLIDSVYKWDAASADCQSCTAFRARPTVPDLARSHRGRAASRHTSSILRCWRSMLEV